MIIKKAAKAATKLRVLLAGTPGSGKTYTALRIGAEMAKLEGARLGLIDTEHGSAQVYSAEPNPDGGVFEFDTIDLSKPDETGSVSYSVQRYTKALQMFSSAGYPVVVIDSISHAWNGPGGVLSIVDRIDKGISGWAKATPVHQAFVETLLGYPGHVIMTARTKIEWDLSDAKRPVKVGTALVQREGMEYEVSCVFEMDVRHNATVSKSRLSVLQDRYIERPGAEVARLLHAWAHGAEPTAAELLASAGLRPEDGWTVELIDAWCEAQEPRWATLSSRPPAGQRAFVAKLSGPAGEAGRGRFLSWLAAQSSAPAEEGAGSGAEPPPDGAGEGAEGSTPSTSTGQKPAARRKGRAA